MGNISRIRVSPIGNDFFHIMVNHWVPDQLEFYSIVEYGDVTRQITMIRTEILIREGKNLNIQNVIINLYIIIIR